MILQKDPTIAMNEVRRQLRSLKEHGNQIKIFCTESEKRQQFLGFIIKEIDKFNTDKTCRNQNGYL